MQVVDSHHHLWSPKSHPWLQDVKPSEGIGKLGFSPIARTFGVQQHQELLQQAGLQCIKSVYLQCEHHVGGRDPVEETVWASEQAADNACGIPTAIVGYADIDKPDVLCDQLARHRQYPRFRGIRFMLDWDPDRPGIRQTSRSDWMQDPSFLKGLGMLEATQGAVSFDLQLCQCQLVEAAQMARKFPSLTFVLNHAGFPLGNARDNGLLVEWQQGMAALASAPNVVCKVGALCTYDAVLGYGTWTAEAIAKYTKECFSLFGARRCLWESNLPTDLLVGDFSARTAALLEAANVCTSGEELNMFLQENAMRVYRLHE